VGWTVMEHHYHAIVRPAEGSRLPKFVSRLHGRVAICINREDQTPGRVVFYQY
jgi:hypothetical protein